MPPWCFKAHLQIHVATFIIVPNTQNLYSNVLNVQCGGMLSIDGFFPPLPKVAFFFFNPSFYWLNTLKLFPIDFLHVNGKELHFTSKISIGNNLFTLMCMEKWTCIFKIYIFLETEGAENELLLKQVITRRWQKWCPPYLLLLFIQMWLFLICIFKKRGGGSV